MLIHQAAETTNKKKPLISLRKKAQTSFDLDSSGTIGGVKLSNLVARLNFRVQYVKDEELRLA